jgi:hypothetical protein
MDTMIKIEDCELSVRSENVLINNGIKYLNELTEYTFRDVLSFRQIGKKSIQEIRTKLAFYELSFKDESLDLDLRKTILIDLPKILREMKEKLNQMKDELRFFSNRIELIATYAEKTNKKVPNE